MEINKDEILKNMYKRLTELECILNSNNLKVKNKIEREIEYIKLCIDEKYLILDEYVNNSTKVKMMCNKGHIVDTIAPSRFKNGRRCKECFNLERKNKMRNSKKSLKAKDDFYKIAQETKYIVLGDYVSHKDSIEMKCPKGHTTNTLTPGSFKSGTRCRVCYELNRGTIRQNSDSVKKAKEEFYKLAEKEGYVVLGEYTRTDIPVKMKCPKGHITDSKSNALTCLG
ncbi:MAG: hypothetical protein RSD36_13475 [Terrisporobacter sp.]